MLHAMNTLSMACMVEPILWFLALFTYSRFTPRANSVYFLLYLATQLAASALSVPVLFWLVTWDGHRSPGLVELYTQMFWWGAIFSGFFAIAALRDILKRLLTSLVGLQRVALITFQWMLVVACFVILDRMVSKSGQVGLVAELAILANGISVTQLVLLLPILPFTFIERRSLRSHFQDVMMGLGILAASSSVLGIIFHTGGRLSSGAVVAGQIILVTTLIFWICCFANQERQEHPRMLSVDSKLVRWSEWLRMLDRAPVQRGR
jgi:hypothetical protein